MKMKRLFTLLMAIWALLSISQAVKAADVTVYFQKPDWWSTPVQAYVYDDAGKYFKEWKDADNCTPYTTTNNGIKLWSYTFPDQYTNVIFKDGTNQYPANDGTKMKVKNNYVYTINGTTGTPLSEFDKVTKVIKLFNGSSELTGSNGKYTLDLSSATADATITLSIDGTSYGLATAKTISAAGATNVDFVANAPAALTLIKGFIYYLSVKEDGKMTVVAKEKGAADGNYYLVGNFFEKDGDNINYDNKYFRFIKNKDDGKLTFDIPASLSIKAQVYGADGKCYGPVNGESLISNTNPSATEVPVNGDLGAGDKYWTFKDRGLAQTGIYTITITVDPAGTPAKWEVKYDNSKRMAYFLVDPTEDYDAVVHPSYAVVKADRSCNNNFYGNIYLEAGKHCFVVGNITKNYANNGTAGNPLTTTPKLYLQGNGGLDPTKTVPDSERDKYTKVYPNKTEGFTYNETKSMVLEYNPSKGHNDVANESGNNGIGGEILKASAQITDNDNPITSVQIVGNGVVDSWELDDAQEMKYNKKLDCWEYTFKTKNGESADNKFRFIANRDWKYNWGEESIKAEDQARTPYTDKNKAGHEASLNDPNELGFTTNGTAENRNGAGTYGDMIFNRPAGEWTIRLYIRTLETEDGNGYVVRHAYTITGSESKDIYLTYRKDRFIRTYSNDKPMNPVDDNVKIYEVYKYEKPDGGDADIYKRGTVHLRRLKYVPANVGVVLIGEAPAGTYTDGQKVAFSLLERTEESVGPDGDYREVWTKSDEYIAANDQWNNYLVPTVKAVNDLGNAKVDESGKITYRYFGLGNYYRTNYHTSLGNADTQEDYIGFFRLTANGKSGANKAYLSIPANAEVGNGVGVKYGFIDYNGQLLGNEDDSESPMPAQLAKMALVFDDLVDGNETTGIKELETKKMNNNKYYNLQGIEIAHPVKGIYIHNGKKVIVK